MDPEEAFKVLEGHIAQAKWVAESEARAAELLMGFLDTFDWLSDHDAFKSEVRKWLVSRPSAVLPSG